VTSKDSIEALKSSPLATEMDDAEVAALARVVELRDYADGDVLVREGESSPTLFVPLAGRIAVVKPDELGELNTLHMLGPGDLAGELSFMDGAPRYASMVASGPVKVLTLDRGRFEELLSSHPVAVYKAMRAIMRVAHRVQRRLSSQMVDMQHYLYRTGAKY
jgi:CRP-like cAMP-binding protein